MLSDLGDADTKFGLSLSYSLTDAGNTTYNTAVLGARYRLLDWLQVTGSLPYTYINGKDTFVDTIIVDDVPVEQKSTIRYDTVGFGDATLMGWVNLTYPFLSHENEDTTLGDDLNPPPEPFEGIGIPTVYFGAGVKFANGEHAERDREKYARDRLKAQATGERSIADGAVPPYSQLGTGTTDLLLGMFYQQRFGRLVTNAGLSYQHAGGRNSIGYERGDRVSWNAGLKYTLYRAQDCSQVYIRGGMSGLVVVEKDRDHSEDTTQLGSQEVGRVEDTDGSYTYWAVSLGYDIGKKWSLIGGVQLPVGNHNRDSDNAFDASYSMGVQYRF